MPADYIPTREAQIVSWADNFSTLITSTPTTYGLVAGDAVAIAAAVDPYILAYTVATNPSTRTPATVANKDALQAAMLATVRPFAVQISQNAGVTNEDKTAVGVTVRKTVPTPIPTPTTRPGLTLASAQVGVLTIRYSDVDMPVGKAKPPGAIGMELWVQVGLTPGIDPDAASYVSTITKSPYNLQTKSGDRGKLATIWGRWCTRGGSGGESKVGPWSDPLTVTVM